MLKLKLLKKHKIEIHVEEELAEAEQAEAEQIYDIETEQMEAVQMVVEAEQMYNMEELVENVCKEQNLIDGADVIVVEQHLMKIKWNRMSNMQWEDEINFYMQADFKLCLIVNNNGCKKRQSITST